MKFLLDLVARLGTNGAVVVVFAVFGVGGYLVERASRSTLRRASKLRTAKVDELETVGSGGELSLASEWLKNELIVADRERDEYVVREYARGKLIERFVDEFEEAARPWIGPALTGVALIFTFLLIAGVLSNEVPGAIRSADERSSELLSDAVSRMGSKFVISATGVGLSLLHRIGFDFKRRSVVNRVTEDVTVFARQFVSADVLDLRAQRQMVAELQGLGERIYNGVERMSREIDHLRVIEVTVKDLGTSVSQGLASMFKDTLAQQLRTLLEDMKASAQSIEDRMSEVANAAMRRTADEIRQELRAINTTLQSQAGSQVEQLLGRLQDAVSGGFSSQSKATAESLAEFAEVIPRLGSQMDVVVERFEGVVAQLARQQDAQARLFEGLGSTSQTQVETFSQALAQSGRAAMGQVLTETSQGLEGILRSVSLALEQSHASVGTVHTNMSGAATAIAAALNETQQAARATEHHMQQLSASLSHATQSGRALQGVATSMSESVRALDATVTRMGAVGDAVAALVRSQQDVQNRQAELAQRMNDVWPALLEVVATRVQDSTSTLSSTWTTASGQLEKAMSHSVVQFADAVEDLAENVSKLQQVLAPTPHGGPPALPGSIAGPRTP